MRLFTILKLPADKINDPAFLSQVVIKEVNKIQCQQLKEPVIEMIVKAFSKDEYLRNIIKVQLMYDTPGTAPICLN